jgi:hypothetical protein
MPKPKLTMMTNIRARVRFPQEMISADRIKP